MVHRAALSRGPHGNRRFHDWWFYVIEDEVHTAHHLLDKGPPSGTMMNIRYGDFTVPPCSDCNGLGCRRCTYPDSDEPVD